LERARNVRGAEQRRELLTAITAAIAPFNLAGLGNPAVRNWYPVGESRGRIPDGGDGGISARSLLRAKTAGE
jgi:hypothetical protein